MNVETSRLIAEAFLLLRVQTFFDLSRVYSCEDQKLMKSGEWDAFNPILITNKVKVILERIDPMQLNEVDHEWWSEILWFWYHHAVSYAIWKAKDKKLACEYADEALKYQEICQPPDKGQQNRLTRLLWLLVHDKLDEAKRWMSDSLTSADPIEHANGLELIQEYERCEFF